MTNKTKMVLVLITAFSILTIGIVGSFVLKDKHYAEIEQVIKKRDGEIIKIEKSDKEVSPFKENTRGNVIYKITYKKDEKIYIAWYRATKTVNDIHTTSRRGADEKWIFND
jgi:hypothetical protein